MSGILAALAGIKTAIATAVDEYFNRTTLLLNTSSTNGAQNNTFLDSSTNNFTITRNGNTTQGTFTPFSQTGWGNYFNGSSDYIYNSTGNANLAFGTGDFTVECWVYLTSLPSVYGAPVSVGASSGGWAINCVPSGSNFYFRWDTFAGSFATTGNYNTNTWYHVAFVRSGTTITCYVNGISAGTSSSYSENLSISSNLYIGTSAASTSRYQPGYISNIRLVKGTAVYTGAFTPSTTPLTAISGTSLLTCQSNRFLDNSASAIAFTIGGTPSVQAFSPFAPTAAYDTAVVGGSGYFDGSGDYLSTSSNAAFAFGTGDFEVDFWIYATSLPASDNNILNQNLSSGTPQFYIDSTGKLQYRNAFVGAVLTSNTTFKTGQWYYCVISRVSGTSRMFINGSLDTSGSDSTDWSNTAGWYVSNSSGSFTGYISNVRLVKGSGITSSTVPTAPLTAITNTSLLLSATNSGIYDSTAKNVLETVGNAQVSTTQAKWGTTSMYFDGTGDYLTAKNNPAFLFNTGDFTVELWYYPLALTGTPGNAQSLVGMWGTGNVSWLFYLNAGNLYWYTSTNGSTQTATINAASGMSVNNWYHLALCRSGGTTRIFVNGVSIVSTTTSVNLFNATCPLTIGFNPVGGTPDHVYGYIDDLRISNGVARYTANFTPPTAAFPLQ